MKTNNVENFEKLISNEKSGWLDKALWREANENWLGKSALIAIKILSIIKEKGISQKTLAEDMGLSTQYISKVLKGNENLSLETISKFEKALGIELIEVIGFTTFVNYDIPMPSQSSVKLMIFAEKTWQLAGNNYSNYSYCEEEAA